MFDTMTLTKTVGALCGSLLIFLLGLWFAEVMYHTGSGGHGDEHHQAYVIDTGADDSSATAEAEPEVDFGELLASADAASGEKLFKKCQSCHKLEDGANATGPHLYKVVDRAVGSVDGFNYSGALVAVAETWTPENLNGFLADPKKYAPGTKMVFKGFKKPQERADIVAFLQGVGG